MQATMDALASLGVTRTLSAPIAACFNERIGLMPSPAWSDHYLRFAT